jgi:hypothetical protein
VTRRILAELSTGCGHGRDEGRQLRRQRDRQGAAGRGSRDLEELQRKLLGVTTRLAESMVTLADRVTKLEQQGTGGG